MGVGARVAAEGNVEVATPAVAGGTVAAGVTSLISMEQAARKKVISTAAVVGLRKIVRLSIFVFALLLISLFVAESKPEKYRHRNDKRGQEENVIPRSGCAVEWWTSEKVNHFGANVRIKLTRCQRSSSESAPRKAGITEPGKPSLIHKYN